jgi:NADH dehydrogenase [ubiquinone] 1 alpha subcomplex assembly factor 7
VTPLAAHLAATIRSTGPIGVDTFMAIALGDPRHGYYMTRDPLGASGDFTTSPEISQVFGEILGLWCADQWQKMGAPSPVNLVELGPGRGTLMADMLRAMKVLPACRAAVRVHLVEISPVLRACQQMTIKARHPDIEPHWHESLDTVPAAPLLLVANEFFDALPIRQWVRSNGNWHERLIALDADDALVFTTGPAADPPVRPPADAPDGSIFETNGPALTVATEIGKRLATSPGAALLIDYGHAKTSIGETLQAMRGHRYAPVLTDPGEADITAHVDFEALSRALTVAGAAVGEPMTQGRFLIDNGAELRAQALIAGKAPDTMTAIRRGIRRLLDPAGMGRLFKVLTVTTPRRLI